LGTFLSSHSPLSLSLPLFPSPPFLPSSQVLALSMEEVVESANLHQGHSFSRLPSTVRLPPLPSRTPLGSFRQSQLNKDALRVSFREEAADENAEAAPPASPWPAPAEPEEPAEFAARRALEEAAFWPPAGSGTDSFRLCMSNGGEDDAASWRDAGDGGAQAGPSQRAGRRRVRSAVRGGTRLGGRCPWAVRVVRGELRRRAWGVLAGQAQLQVGGPLRPCWAVWFFSR
jgi:hypothetical protein